MKETFTECKDCGMCCTLREPRKCMFLDQNMNCKIYLIRPIRCRSFKYDCEVCKLIRKKVK